MAAAIKEPIVAGNVGNMKTICKWKLYRDKLETVENTTILGRGILIQSLPLLLGPGGRGGIGNINKNDIKI